MNTRPERGHPNHERARVGSTSGGWFSPDDDRATPKAARRSVLQDPSKAVGLLFGILAILALFGIVIIVRMLWTAEPAGLVEILLFGLLAADAAILITAVRGRVGPGLIGYMSVWVLGLIPYFGWVIVYGAGRGIAARIERRKANATLIALLVWGGVVLLCLGIHVFFAGTSRLP